MLPPINLTVFCTSIQYQLPPAAPDSCSKMAQRMRASECASAETLLSDVGRKPQSTGPCGADHPWVRLPHFLPGLQLEDTQCWSMGTKHQPSAVWSWCLKWRYFWFSENENGLTPLLGHALFFFFFFFNGFLQFDEFREPHFLRWIHWVNIIFFELPSV